MNGDHSRGKGGRSSATVRTRTTGYITGSGAIGSTLKIQNRISKEHYFYMQQTHTQINIPTNVNNVTKKPDANPFGAAAAVTGRNVDVGAGTGTGSGAFGKPVAAPVAEATP